MRGKNCIKSFFNSYILQNSTLILQHSDHQETFICLSENVRVFEAVFSCFGVFSLVLYNPILCREKLNSMNLMLYMAPIAVLVLLPASLIMEPKVIDVTLDLGREHKFMWLLLLVNSVMAYSANLSNFLVTKHTSPLTLQVFISFFSFFFFLFPISNI